MANVRIKIWKSRSDRRRAPCLASELAELIRALHTLIEDPYRPELHYMRGPGPKWHAKHDPGPAAVEERAVSGLIRANA